MPGLQVLRGPVRCGARGEGPEREITLEQHPIAILDRFSQGTEFSSRSAGAAFCVAESDSDLYFDYAKVLFENQPAENTPA